MDVRRLRDSFARVAMHGDSVPQFFYSDLFLRHPEVRELFPVSMAGQRDRFLHALATIVSQAGNLPALREYLSAFGREHRRFGTLAEHYPAMGVSLLATLAHLPMVEAVACRLTALGVPASQIHVEDFGWSES